MKFFKLKLVFYSLLIFTTCLTLFYILNSYLQYNTFQFCKTNYCFSVLSIGEFISSLIAVLGIGGVIISLDTWKQGQRYLEKKELLLLCKKQLNYLKQDVYINYNTLSIHHDLFHNLKYSWEVSDISEILKKFKYDQTKLKSTLDKFIQSSNAYAKDKNHDNKENLVNSAKDLYSSIKEIEDCVDKIISKTNLV